MLQVGRLTALIGLLGLGLSAAHAQILPPSGYFEWSGNGGDGLWQTGTNWIGGPNGTGGEPTLNADVLFANTPPANNPEGNPYQLPITVDHNTPRRLNALWFDTGREYTISGQPLSLGRTLEDGGHLITGLNRDPSKWQSEHNIDAAINIQLTRAEWTAQIASYSAGGLGIGGDLTFTRGSLRQTGGGAIHIAGAMKSSASNPGNLTVATNAGHLILSGNNSGWRGNLTVNHGFLVATANNALGSAASGRMVSINGTWSGASLAFRPKFVGSGLNNSSGMDYTASQSVTVTGRGYLRPWGSADPSDPHSQLNLRAIGAIYNDGGNNTFAGDITALGETWFGSRHGVLTLTGRLFGESFPGGNFLSFTKVGRGVIALANGNPSWDEGYIEIREGVLRLSHADALDLSKNLIVFYGDGSGFAKGGILELGAANFSGTLGIDDPGQIGWEAGSDGGFSAHGANRSVTLNNSAELTWGSGVSGNGSTYGFVDSGALLLNSDYGTHQILLTNPIMFNAANREIRVARGATTDAHAVLVGKLTGSGGILKTGRGTLWLRNTRNNYAGATVIREGTLRGRVLTSRIDFDGGVLGIDSDFTRNLGTFNNRIRWLPNRDGGFASYSTGVARSVTLGTEGSIITFGQANFVSAGSYLIFGAYDAPGTVLFNNRIGLRSNATSSIRLISGTHGGTQADVVFSQKFDGPGPSGAVPIGTPNKNYNLFFEGDGRADINQAHTATDWEGTLLQVRGAELRLNQAGTLKGLTGNWLAKLGGGWEFSPGTLRAEWGGTVTLDNQGSYNSLNSGGQSVADRLFDQINIRLNAGTFRLWGGTSNLVETAGELHLEGGANTLVVRGPLATDNVISLAATRLHLSKLVHDGFQNPTIDFVGVGLPGRGGTGRMLTFATAPNEINGVLPYATVNGTDWARTQTQNGLNYLTAYTGYVIGGAGNWAPEFNASPASNIILSEDRFIGTLRLTSGRQVNVNNNKTLTLASGGLLATGTSTTKILGGTLQSGWGPQLYAHVYNTAAVGLEISSGINFAGLIKTGPGLLLLSGGGTVTATTTRVHEGTLALGRTSTNYLGGNIIVGDRSGTDILRLDRSEQIANDATVTLRGGHPDPSRFLMAEGILQFNGINGSGVGIRETIGNLTIEGRGVIDFRGGSVGHANYLIIEGCLTIGPDSQLFIRNWHEFEDYLLINRNCLNVALDRITFEGYGPAIFRPWNGGYWLITPAPEPTTYGAILGVVGVGLVVWRKRRRKV